jgi:hypothetical protein
VVLLIEGIHFGSQVLGVALARNSYFRLSFVSRESW